MQYLIDGKALPEANGGVKLRFSDLESGETGLDESGFLHRVVLRRGLRSWEFAYRELTPTAYGALLALLPQKDSFLLQCQEGQILCWLESLTAARRDSLQGPVYQLCFTLKEC